MSTLPYVRFIHVLAAIIALGTNATYGVWIGRAANNRTHLDVVLRGVKFLDDRVANPAYGVLLLTGLLMVWIGHYSIIGTFWLEAGVSLYVLAVGIAAAGYTPTLRRQIAALEVSGPDSPEYRRLAVRGTVLGILLEVIVVVIVFDMVVKPFS